MTLSECSPFTTDFKGDAACTEIQTGLQWDKPKDEVACGSACHHFEDIHGTGPVAYTLTTEYYTAH